MAFANPNGFVLCNNRRHAKTNKDSRDTGPGVRRQKNAERHDQGRS